MRLLINESPLQVLPGLAYKIGLNEAIFLQQLHFRSLVSKRRAQGFIWVAGTYQDWQRQMPFWSVMTIRRMIQNLERENYIISSSSFNKHKNNQTKWYRINYESDLFHSSKQSDVCERPPETVQIEHAGCTERSGGGDQIEQNDLFNSNESLLKELKNHKNKHTNAHAALHQEVINYLNEKTGKQFKASSSSTRKLLNGRISDGYTADDFKKVIDVKTAQWLHHPEFRQFLRPSTLFNATKFENYINEPAGISVRFPNPVYQPFVLDFTKGED